MMTASRAYMDWNATAPLWPEVRDVLIDSIDLLGNPSSVHKEGRAIRASVEAARRNVAALFNAKPTNVIFTSGATEAANLVLTTEFKMGRSALHISHLYVSAIEHPAVREGGRFGKDNISVIPVTYDGVVDLAALEAMLAAHDRTLGMPMVAVMLVNNETGIIQPVSEVAKLVRDAQGILVVDAVQAVGRVDIDVDLLGADFLIVSSHKIGGPKGVGALICRGEVMMPKALIHGGGQEKGHRSGTENTLAIIGFGAAASILNERAVADRQKMLGQRALLERSMRAAAEDVTIYGDDLGRVANTCFFTLPGMKAETGQIAFDLEGVALSAGSACTSGKVGESHVLSAMGRDHKLGGLRISIGPMTTDEEIDKVIAAFAKIAGRRKLSE